MEKIAVISAILEAPSTCQQPFNDVISKFSHIVKGRMGLPFDEHQIAVVTVTVVGDLDTINHLTGLLGKIPNVQVKTAISKRTIEHV
jgi:putative iron-only hydrogenase system regulator